MIVNQQMNSQKQSEIKIVLGGHWRSLHPGLQHVLWADLVLSNQFDSLVGINDFGIISPLGAKFWEISNDMTKFTFTIDSQKRYSNGSYLLAGDYKSSWENALRLEPKSANSSLLDVLYRLEGFESFQDTGSISGIVVESQTRLTLKFKKPFRMALNYLSGNRFSALKNDGAAYLGTGNYVIKELNNDELLLTPNPYASVKEKLAPIHLSWVSDPIKLLQGLKSKAIDVMAYGTVNSFPSELLNESDVSIIKGQEGTQNFYSINATNGTAFSNPNFRLALQYLIYSAIPLYKNQSNILQEFDAQAYLPYQPGRLSAEEVTSLIEVGKNYVTDLKIFSKKHPLNVYSPYPTDLIFEVLKNNGITLSESSGVVPNNQRMEWHYSENPPFDILSEAGSVVSGDPDGLYHLLGKSGAILAPVTYRDKVGQLLEEGRQILDQKVLNDHYQKVSRAILQEVPLVHVSFSRVFAAYRNDLISVGDINLKRNEGHLDFYSHKSILGF